jgi:flagellar protein FliO/FliZ
MQWLGYLEALGIFLLFLSSLPLIAHFYKKISVKNSSTRYIKIIEIKPINYKAQILLIEVEKKKFLIGLSDKGFDYLGEIKDDNA